MGGVLMGVSLLVLVFTQLLYTRFATPGWFTGLVLFAVGGLLMLTGGQQRQG